MFDDDKEHCTSYEAYNVVNFSFVFDYCFHSSVVGLTDNSVCIVIQIPNELLQKPEATDATFQTTVSTLRALFRRFLHSEIMHTSEDIRNQ